MRFTSFFAFFIPLSVFSFLYLLNILFSSTYGRRGRKCMSSSRTLQITYVGMKSQDVPIKSGTIKVMMKSDSEVLQEVVVTGIQKMDKRLFTGAGELL